MAQVTSGKVLREARERKGYDLATVARRLRIRPDILRAIEAGDYAAMPPRGYTRNMVNAYARLLGLNPTEIVNMYLDEVHALEVEKARGSAPSSGFNMQRESRRQRRAETPTSYFENESRTYNDGDGARGLTRVLYDDSTRFSRDDYGVTRERQTREGRSDRDFLSHHSGYSGTTYNFIDDRGGQGRGRGRGRGGGIYAGQTPMQYSASRLPGIFQSRGVLFAAIALVVVIIIVVLVLVIGGRNAPAEDDVSQLPVSGISDTTGSSEESQSAAPVEVAPTSAHVVYSVAKGNDCYIETYTDGGSAAPEMLSGPVEQAIEVTGTWTITTYSPDTIKVTVDGQPVTLKASEEYGNMYAYTVDFPAILEQWKAAHPGKTSQRSAAVADAQTPETESSSAASASATDSTASASAQTQTSSQQQAAA